MKVAPENVQAPLVLTIDVGTSSTRVSLFDRLGRSVEGMHAVRRHQLQFPEPGAAELDPDDLLRSVFDCIDEVLQLDQKLSAEIRSVASTTLVTNIMAISEVGDPLTPLFTYADTRAQNVAAELASIFNEVEVINRTGCRFHTSYLPARLLWLQKHRPDQYEAAHRWISLGEYLHLRLFGQTRVTYSVASWSGLLNRHELEWDEELLDHLPIRRDQLSHLCDFDDPQLDLQQHFAERWPAMKDIPWYPTIGDGAAANIGSMCFSPRRATLTIGTSSAIRITLPQKGPLIPEGLWGYQVTRDLTLIGGALNEGGNLYEWLRSLLDISNPGEVEATLAEMGPDSHRLTILPFLTGERSPGWAGSSRAAMVGLNLRTTGVDILRAGLESVALRLALIFKHLGTYADEVEQIIAGGGAIQKSPTWAKIICDTINQQLLVSDVTESSSRGAAMMALHATGALKELEAASQITGKFYSPDERNHKIYQGALERQQDLYTKLIETAYSE